MKVSLIAAVAENGVIGRNNALIWHLPDDLRFFKKTTLGHAVIMGRKNYESIPEKFRPFSNRKNIVITRQSGFDAPGCTVVKSLKEALEAGSEKDEIFIIGGGQIYELAIRQDLVGTMYITEVHHSFEGDTFFPVFDESRWIKTILEEHPADTKHAYPFTIWVYKRKMD